MKNMLLLLVLFCSMTLLFGQTPSTLSLQGVLREVTGAAAADGDYSMTFKIYDVSTGGSALWTETQSARVNNGVYSVQLGAITALNLNFDRQYYVGVTVGGSELAPRLVLTAAPYAMGLKGSSNIFGGGGNVGIGTTSPDPAQKLHVVGNSYFNGVVGVTQELNVTGNAGFTGISTFSGNTILSPNKIMTVNGRANIVTSGWTEGQGISFTNNESGAANPSLPYLIQRGGADSKNRLAFISPTATNAPSGGFEWMVHGQITLMKLENSVGNLEVAGKITAKGVDIPTASTGIKIIAGMVYSDQLWRGTPGLSVTRPADGKFKITLPTGVTWDKVISVSCTGLQGDGSDGNVRFKAGRENQDQDYFYVWQQWYNNTDNRNSAFFIQIIALN